MSKTETLLLIFTSIATTIIFLIAVVYFLYHYKRKNQSYHIERNQTQMKHQEDLHNATLEMQQLTMSDIGREIHDGVGQKLTLASIYMKQLHGKIASESDKAQAQQIKDIIGDSLQMLRSLSKELTQEDSLQLDLVELIKNELVHLKNLSSVEFQYMGLETLYISNKRAKFILRITQEFIQNSLKYSDCDLIRIHLNLQEDLVSLHLMDNGNGFDANRVDFAGIGLSNMKRRAELIQADYELSSQVGVGTELLLTFQS